MHNDGIASRKSLDTRIKLENAEGGPFVKTYPLLAGILLGFFANSGIMALCLVGLFD